MCGKSSNGSIPLAGLGVLSRTPTANHELIYASSSEGFALASMRNENLSRYYAQVPLTDKVKIGAMTAFGRR